MQTDKHSLEILTPEEVAELLRVPKSWVYEKTRDRQRNPLPVFRIGRYLRFDRSEVIAWLQSTKTVPIKSTRR